MVHLRGIVSVGQYVGEFDKIRERNVRKRQNTKIPKKDKRRKKEEDVVFLPQIRKWRRRKRMEELTEQKGRKRYDLIDQIMKAREGTSPRIKKATFLNQKSVRLKEMNSKTKVSQSVALNSLSKDLVRSYQRQQDVLQKKSIDLESVLDNLQNIGEVEQSREIYPSKEVSIVRKGAKSRNSTSYLSEVDRNDHFMDICLPVKLKPVKNYFSPAKIPVLDNSFLVKFVIYSLSNLQQSIKKGDNTSEEKRLHSFIEPEMNEPRLSKPIGRYLKESLPHISEVFEDPLSQKPLSPRRIRHFREQYRDYKLKAQSCRRANLVLEHCISLYAGCIILDNLQSFEKSRVLYKKILKTVQQLNDRIFECLLLNHLSANYMYEYLLEPDNEMLWNESYKYGNLFLEATDDYGKSIGHVNLGLLHFIKFIRNKESDSYHLSASIDNYLTALKWCRKNKQYHLQLILLPNLALSLIHNRYYYDAIEVMEYCTNSNRNPINLGLAYIIFGHIAMALDMLENAQGYYDESARIFQKMDGTQFHAFFDLASKLQIQIKVERKLQQSFPFP